MAEESRKESKPILPPAPAKNVVLEALMAKDGDEPKKEEARKALALSADMKNESPKKSAALPSALHLPAASEAAAHKKSLASPVQKPAVPLQKSNPPAVHLKPPAMPLLKHPFPPSTRGGQSSIPEMLLWLDSYDDIFSDFDPRNYEYRELSEDFLKELSRRYKETPKGGFEVHLLIPAHLRQAHLEARIKKRLRHYFARELAGVERQLRKKRETGVKFIAAGLLVLSAQTWLLFSYPDRFLPELIGVLLVPAGWFATWTGIERMVVEPENLVSLREFYKKFFRCEYVFLADESPKR